MMRIVLLILLGMMASGCATVTRGTTDQLQFASEPEGATVRTSLGHSCVTPCTLQMGRKDEFVATFSKPGYQSQQVPVSTRIASAGAAGFAGNILIGGIVGMGVDAATGATYEHYPNPVSVSMKPAAVAPSQRAPVAQREKPQPRPQRRAPPTS